MKANQEKLSSVQRALNLGERERAIIERLIEQEIDDAERSGFERGVREAAERTMKYNTAIITEPSRKLAAKTILSLLTQPKPHPNIPEQLDGGCL